MERVIGIDLGTSYSVAAIIENGKARVIPNASGDNLTPSVYAENEKGEQFVGSLAKRLAAYHPDKTVFSIKRFMGTDYRVTVNGKSYTPQEISAFILKKIKCDVEQHLKEPVSKAVITVPAYFNHAAREATKEAGLIAGFEVLRIINEPTAAALAYGLDRQEIKTILVWDLGGGTFDVSIMELSNGFFHVKAVNGNNMLGGDDWDQRFVDHIAMRFSDTHGFDPRENKISHQRIKEVCEKAKKDLSDKIIVKCCLSQIPSPSGDFVDFEEMVDRRTFEDITEDITGKLLLPTRQALSDAKLTIKEIDRVILVGGATRMPAIQKLAENFFEKKPYLKMNPDEVVAIGAAIQAGILTGDIKDVALVDVIPLSVGIETQGGLFAKIIPKNSTIPTSETQIFTTAQDNQTSMDFNVLQGERELADDNFSIGQFQLTDITPLPRGDAKVEVSFAVDVNGILKVSAQDLYSENQITILIDSVSMLSEEQINQAVKDAELYAEADFNRREKIKATIKAEHLINNES